MNIVILGAGRTGSYVASALAKEKYNVTLIDKEAATLEKVSRESDVATLLAFPPSWTVFEELIEGEPDLFFAATGDDEVNLLACSIAKQVGFPKAVARIKGRAYLNHPQFDFAHLFRVDHLLAPDVLASQDLLKLLIHDEDIALEHFAHGAIQMRTLLIPEKWDRGGTPLAELSLPEELIVALIRRKTADGESLIIPHGQDHLLPGDLATFIGEAEVVHRLHDLFKAEERLIRSIVLVGGSFVAIHLTEFLQEKGVAVRILEQDRARCEKLADLLPQATLINRDAKDLDMLQSERVQHADALVCCTHDDGTNLLISSMAKHLGCRKVLAMINDANLTPILEKLGVIPVLSARVNITHRLLSILHEETLLAITPLYEEIKIVELKIAATSKLVGAPLSDLKHDLPPNLLVAAIESHGKVVVGRGNKTLRAGDTAILICPSPSIPELKTLFQS